MSDAPESGVEVSAGRRAAAWLVHAYTALGLPLAFLGMQAVAQGDASTFFLAQAAAVFVDATDGTLARRVQVKRVLPGFDGGMLDNLIDFLTFAFLPCLAVPAFGLVPEGWAWVAVVPLLASGFQFSQTGAKTEESFVGFPSYWNILLLYLFVLEASAWVTVGALLVCSVLSFVPFHYVYPSKTRQWMPVTVVLGSAWALVLTLVCAAPSAPWAAGAAWASLVFPVYYGVASVVLHRRIQRAGPAAAAGPSEAGPGPL